MSDDDARAKGVDSADSDMDKRIDELFESQGHDVAATERRAELLLGLATERAGSWTRRLQDHEDWPAPVAHLEDVPALIACCRLTPHARFGLVLDEAADDAVGELVASGCAAQVMYLWLESRHLPPPLAQSLASAPNSIELLSIDGPAFHPLEPLYPLLINVPNLTLGNGAIDESALLRLAPELQRTEVLDIYHCAIERTGVDAIAKLSIALRDLSLVANSIDGEVVERLAASHHPLEALNISRNPCGDRAAVALVDAKFAPTLRFLSLNRTDLSDLGALALANGRFPQLRELRLSDNNKIGFEGLRAIARSTRMSAIEDLHLDGNGWTTIAHARLLAESTTLHPQVREEWREILKHRLKYEG